MMWGKILTLTISFYSLLPKLEDGEYHSDTVDEMERRKLEEMRRELYEIIRDESNSGYPLKLAPEEPQVAEPPVAAPPAAEPQVAEPPAAEPQVAEPPAAESPAAGEATEGEAEEDKAAEGTDETQTRSVP